MPEVTKKAPLFVEFDQFLPLVDAELAKGKGWTSTAHGLTLAGAAIMAYEQGAIDHGLKEKDLLLFIARSLDQHGLGGNASQFRQWLASKQGGNRIEKSESRSDKYE
jgi:hypothetical protein